MSGTTGVDVNKKIWMEGGKGPEENLLEVRETRRGEGETAE